MNVTLVFSFCAAAAAALISSPGSLDRQWPLPRWLLFVMLPLYLFGVMLTTVYASTVCSQSLSRLMRTLIKQGMAHVRPSMILAARWCC